MLPVCTLYVSVCLGVGCSLYCTTVKPVLRPAYTAHKFQRLPLIFCFWNKSPNCFVLEFQKQVPETFAVYAGLKDHLCKGLHTLQKFLELVSVTPIQSNRVVCSRNKRSKGVSGTCVQCMQALIRPPLYKGHNF